MAARRRTPDQRERDLDELSRRRTRGESLWTIAQAMGISKQQVYYDLSEVRRRWRADATRSFDDAVAAELAKIDVLEATYWEAWLASKAPRETSTTESTELPPGVGGVAARQIRRARLQRQERDGAAAFLAGVQWCIERRCKLLGLDAPARIDITERVRELAREQGLDEGEAVAMAERIVRGQA